MAQATRNRGISDHGGRRVNETRMKRTAGTSRPYGGIGRARGWARLALALVVGCVAVVLSGFGSGGWLIMLAGFAGLALAGAGVWWMLAHRGGTRLLGGLLAVAAPMGVLVLYAASGLWIVAAGAFALWAAALASARSALRNLRRPRGMHTRKASPGTLIKAKE